MDIEQKIEKLPELLLETENSAPKIPHLLEASLLPSRTSKFRKLINETNATPVKLYDGAHKIELRSPAYVTELYIHSSTPNKAFQAITIKAIGIDGKPLSINSSKTSDGISTDIGNFVSKIQIDYNKALISSRLEISSIDIYGWRPEELDSLTHSLEKFYKHYENLLSYKSQLSSSIEKTYHSAVEKRENAIIARNEIKSEIEAKSVDLENIDAELNEKKSDLEDLRSTIDNLNSQKSNINNYVELSTNKNSQLNEEISQKEERIRDLDTRIGQMRIDLERLENNKNLFAESFEEYANQGASYTKTYFLFSSIPIITIVAIAIYLLDSGQDIWKLSTEIKEVGIKDLLLSKLPFTLLCLAVIQSLYSIAHTFIVKAIAIGRDRLQLSKSQLLAREAHDAIIKDLDIPKEVKYHYLLNLRMQMLKAHLSKNIDDYSHDPDANLDPELRTWYSDLKQYLSGKLTKKQLERDDDSAGSQ